MEELFVGNSVILLFWVYISFIIDIDEYYKKIILMYLITYIANVLNIVPTYDLDISELENLISQLNK